MPDQAPRMAALKTMTVKELKAEWAKLMGSEAPNNSSQFMIQRLSYRIQELAFGGMSKSLVRTLDALADEYEGKKVRKSVIADPRNPIIGTRLIGWASRAIAGTKIRIGDEQGNTLPFGETGEIMVKGPHVMREYWRKPDVTAETIVDGWLRTGDVGMMNEDGFLKLVDRSKDMLISGGINVYPAEIEKALAGVEGISELAVIGVPDSEWGEVPMVVAHGTGDRGAVIQALEQAGNETLAKFKRPRHIVFIDEPLPRTLSGKISKPSLREAFPTAAGAKVLFRKSDS